MKLAQKLAVNYLRAKLNIISLVSTEKAAVLAFGLFCTPVRRSRKKKPEVFRNAEKLTIEVQGLKLRGYRWNAAQEKKCLIIHGFESSSYNFDRFVSPLIKKGYEVLAFDAPAHGRSEGKQITLPLYVAALQKIYQLFGPVQSFIAHSFGGLVLTQFLETQGHDEQTRIVLIAPATEMTTAIDSFFQFLQLNGEVRKKFDELILQKGGRLSEEYSISRAMHHIRASTLWIHDEEDDMTPLADALKIKEKDHAHVEFIITSGLGHRRIYRDNHVRRRIFDFL